MIVTPLNNFNFRIVRSIDGRPIENVELSLRLQENSTLDVPSTAHEHSQPPISIVPLNESHEVFNHSQQSRSLASRHSSQVNLAHMNENVPSSIHPTSTSIQAKPLIVQSPSTFTRNSIEDRTDRLYEHIVRVQIHSTVDGVSFSTEQPLHFFSHKPNSQIEVVEIWQNEKPLYRKLPRTLRMMQSLSTFDDPNVAIQRIEDFAEHCEQSVENDRWASELFEFEYPEVGEIQFGLLFTPKTTLNSSPSKLCMQIMDVSSQFSISMKCDAWIETIDKTRSATKSQKFTFDTNATFKSWSPFLLSDEMSEFLNSSTIFICCRLPYPVKSIGSISKNSTLYRWPITDFESRFNSAQFNTRWESDKFTVSGLDGVKFCLSFCPKGDRETSKNSCAFYLWVKDLAGRSKVSVAYDLWIENSKSRFHKIGMIYVFSTATGYGTSSYVNQEELCKFAQIGPFDICCNVRPIVEPVPSFKCASMHSEIASFFNDPYFSDVEIRVDNEVFKVNRAIISGSSPVFRAMFDKETEEQKSGVVKIKGFEAAMVEKMLIYIYKGEISNMKAIAAQLLPIADCYQVNSLVKKCTDSIVANLTVEKVLPILELAFEHDHLNDFQDRVFNFAHKNYGAIRELSSYEEFLTDRPKIAIKLISVFYTSG